MGRGEGGGGDGVTARAHFADKHVSTVAAYLLALGDKENVIFLLNYGSFTYINSLLFL